MSREEVAVISAVRSPFGKFGGTLKDFTLPKLGGLVAAEAIRRAGIAPGGCRRGGNRRSTCQEVIALLPASC